jgi:hypothetical protein
MKSSGIEPEAPLSQPPARTIAQPRKPYNSIVKDNICFHICDFIVCVSKEGDIPIPVPTSRISLLNLEGCT